MRGPNVRLFVALLLGIILSAGCSLSKSSSPATPAENASVTYHVSLFPLLPSIPGTGQVSVTSDGKVTTQLSGATASTTFTEQFCPAPAQNYPCFNVGTVTSDASGNAKTTTPFTTSGTWAGDFELVVNGNTQYATNVPSSMETGVYSATLEPQATTNGNGTFVSGTPPPQAPLTNGTLTLTNGMLQIQLTGSLPNTVFIAVECPVNFGSDCYTLYSGQTGTFTTDANGNASFSVQLDGVTGDLFTLYPQGAGNSPADAGFIGGFEVP
jgi:hypothetical protein